MKAKVYVSYKDGVLDPQGQAVRNAIAKMGYSGFKSVRQGKFFEIELEGLTRAEAERAVDEVADKLLHNVNIEKYRFEIEE
jgi:phosphoribosylformylglycinamidine synthase PurS subunit